MAAYFRKFMVVYFLKTMVLYFRQLMVAYFQKRAAIFNATEWNDAKRGL